MLILNENNVPIDLNLIPEECDIYFWVFDNNNGVKDYFCTPLIMLESFYSPTIKLKLSMNNSRNKLEYFINLPADYQILIGEPSHMTLEINPITSLSGRHFNAFSANPLTCFKPDFFHIDCEDILPSIKWYVPKIKNGQLICIPLLPTYNSPCIYITRDMPKSLELIHMEDIF